MFAPLGLEVSLLQCHRVVKEGLGRGLGARGSERKWQSAREAGVSEERERGQKRGGIFAPF